MSIPPWATIEKFNAALPIDLSEWAILPPLAGLAWVGSPAKRKKDSAFDPATICDLPEPHSTLGREKEEDEG